MSLYDEILTDLTGTTKLSIVLRKAKVLSYKLKNKEFKDWIENEFNGYTDADSIPQYRIVSTISQGDFSNGYKIMRNFSIPLNIIPKEYRNLFNKIYLKHGIKELESMCETASNADGDTLKMSIHYTLYHFLNYKVFEGMQCFEAWSLLSKSQIVQVIDSTRNKLLDFILELADKYPEVESDINLINPIPNEQIKQIFNYSIYGGKQNITGSANSVTQGDNMSVFDQRNQTVNTQYNAAQDINFGTVQNQTDFVAELQKLKTELMKAAESEAIEGEIVTDAEYQMTKAIQQSQKDAPNKKTILEHLGNAKQLVEGVVATAGIVEGITKAIEVAQTIFK